MGNPRLEVVMSPFKERIPSIGLHVLYEPEKSDSTLIE
jgi:hypothetical protein